MNCIACENESCMHNQQKCCDAAIIQVRGGTTLTGDHTYCNSYATRRSRFAEFGSDINSIYTGDDREQPLIACTAIRCRHNEQYACKADRVIVGVSDEHCLTPTQCRTFHPR